MSQITLYVVFCMDSTHQSFQFYIWNIQLTFLWYFFSKGEYEVGVSDQYMNMPQDTWSAIWTYSICLPWTLINDLRKHSATNIFLCIETLPQRKLTVLLGVAEESKRGRKGLLFVMWSRSVCPNAMLCLFFSSRSSSCCYLSFSRTYSTISSKS